MEILYLRFCIIASLIVSMKNKASFRDGMPHTTIIFFDGDIVLGSLNYCVFNCVDEDQGFIPTLMTDVHISAHPGQCMSMIRVHVAEILDILSWLVKAQQVAGHCTR